MIDLSKDPRLQLVIAYALKHKCLMFSPQSSEIQHADLEYGSPYQEGFSAEDVSGFWYPDSILTYLKGNWDNFKSGLEFGFFRAFSFLSLGLPWSSWCWTIDSRNTLRYDIVTAAIAKETNRKKKNDLYKEFNSLLLAVTEDQIEENLSRNYIQVSKSLWISPNDPSVMVYDERFKSYNLLHGWSKAQLGEILEEWFKLVTDQEIKSKFIENASW